MMYFTGHEEVAKILIDNNADVHVKGNSGNTLLIKATAKGVNFFLFNSDQLIHSLSVRPNNPLSLPIFNFRTLSGRENIVKLLLDNHVDPNIVNNDGESALHFAAQNGIAKILTIYTITITRKVLNPCI